MFSEKVCCRRYAMHTLFGDGVHDDYPAIQEMLDSDSCEIRLPMPQKQYTLSHTLRIHSGQALVLPRYAVIRMTDAANCPMLTADGEENITLQGGIWDYNNLGQAKNPIHFPDPTLPDYHGFMFFFHRIRNLHISGITAKDPVNFCIVLDTVRYFTVENVVFDFNYGNPWAVNMDGVHLNGNCHYGLIRNCQGACYDDLVALNADEGSGGPISHIEVDGIFSEDCHSAVRLLSVNYPVTHIHIHNVHGTFYQYCIGITKYYDGPSTGWYDALLLENIHASKATRHSIYHKDGTMEYPLFWFEGNLHIRGAVLRDLWRQESVSDVPMIKIEAGTVIDRLQLSRVFQQAESPLQPPVFINEGTVRTLLCDTSVPGDQL